MYRKLNRLILVRKLVTIVPKELFYMRYCDLSDLVILTIYVFMVM